VSESRTPSEFLVSQNYPNPFNPTTTIKYELPVVSKVVVTIFNTIGQEIATLVNEEQEAGTRSVVWNGSGVAAGVYYYRIHAGNFVATKKLLLLK
jgi:hypothetical protein